MAVASFNIPEKILLVLKQTNWNNQEGYHQAFIVDPSNRAQLERAREWARSYKYELFGQCTEVNGTEVYTDNKDFTVSLLESANTSSQGGKLTFWNCLVEKEGMKAVVGIEQNNLLSVLKQSTLINGTFQENISLTKLSSTGGLVHSGMHEWKSSKQYREKNYGPIKKTTKWELGKSYTTLTREDVYMCDLYLWFEVTEELRDEPYTNSYMRSSNMYKETHHHIKLLDKPKKLHMTFHIFNNSEIMAQIKENSITKLSQLFSCLTNKLEQTPIKQLTYKLSSLVPLFEYNGTIYEKFPSREVGNKQFEIDDYKEALDNYFNTALDIKREIIKDETSLDYSTIVKTFGYSTDEHKRPMEIEEYERILKGRLSKITHMDLGNGVVL